MKINKSGNFDDDRKSGRELDYEKSEIKEKKRKKKICIPMIYLRWDFEGEKGNERGEELAIYRR